MKRFFWITFFVVLLIEVFSVRPHPHTPPQKKTQELSGAIHVHSTFSDGGGDPEEIARAGIAAGLDFVVLTDHNDSRARKKFEKRYDSMDLFVEMESSTPAGHAIAFYSHSEVRHGSDPRISDLAYEHFIGQLHPKDFFICASHPSNLKNPWTQLDRYPEGIEIANFDSFWQRQAHESLFGMSLTALIYPINNFLGATRFFQLYQKDLDTWDTMNVIDPGHFGILGHDSHSKFKLNQSLVFRWPDYRETFRLGANTVFLDEDAASDFDTRKRQIYRAIRKGAIAVSFQLIYPFSGNEWNLSCGDKTFKSGSHVEGKSDCHFQVVLPVHFPHPTRIRLIKDGKPIFEEVTYERIRRIPTPGRGTYRLEVFAHIRTAFHAFLGRDVPYILYNPIYVK